MGTENSGAFVRNGPPQSPANRGIPSWSRESASTRPGSAGDLPVELHHVHVAAFATGDRSSLSRSGSRIYFPVYRFLQAAVPRAQAIYVFPAPVAPMRITLRFVQDVPASTQLLQEIPVELSVRAVLNILYTGIGKYQVAFFISLAMRLVWR